MSCFSQMKSCYLKTSD